MNIEIYLRDAMTGILVLGGVMSILAVVVPRSALGGALCRVASLFRIRVRAASEHQIRLERAENARCAVESDAIPVFLYSAIVAFATAAFTWFGWLPPSAAYALNLLGLVCFQSVNFVRMRQSYQRHIASLTVRSPWSLPPLLLVAAYGLSALPLLYIGHREDVLAAVLVSVSAFATVALAYAVASLPPLLLGDDPEAEMIVDRCIRVKRAQRLIFFAAASLYVFASFTGIGSPMHWPMYWVTFVGVVAVLAWTFVLGFKPSRELAHNG